jgi:hypothetical protein
VRGSPEIPKTHVSGASLAGASSAGFTVGASSSRPSVGGSSVGNLGVAPSFGRGKDQPTATWSDIIGFTGTALVVRLNHAVALRDECSVTLCGEVRPLTEDEEQDRQRKDEAYITNSNRLFWATLTKPPGFTLRVLNSMRYDE